MADIGTSKFSRTARADPNARLQLVADAKTRMIGVRRRRKAAQPAALLGSSCARGGKRGESCSRALAGAGERSGGVVLMHGRAGMRVDREAPSRSLASHSHRSGLRRRSHIGWPGRSLAPRGLC